ncbi:MAG TPA: hydantoinase B/oxoprolinase family protein [Planctomycetaceae bacterium]|nr:hydantoinase B/oxoprolinase family protein [Planctomycetaceae bacterium]
MTWQFWIDVGGTFTDCVAVSPEGEQRVIKVLSSGATKGVLGAAVENRFQTTLTGAPTDFYREYRCAFVDATGQPGLVTTVTASSSDGQFTFTDAPRSAAEAGQRFELTSGEEAPVVAIRVALGLRLDEPIPPVSVRLGTTRGTNALLTRRGAKTGFVTTRGFADVLRIANQDRPHLFELDIQKPEPLFTAVAQIDERLTANGDVLLAPHEVQVQSALLHLQDAGCDTVAICLLHAFANPVHEEFVANIASGMGFHSVSVSNRLSPLIKLVSRGDTTVMDAYLNPVLQGYVATLQKSLPGSDLRFMTSSGGLVTRERFTGKECVLSGPAGGVIGFSKTTQEAGYERCIGFDMGGTSTDVARFDGRFDYEFETVKAGVRIVTPMMAIETVAAGGGSVCGFDGVKLFVGPQSAGSDPGPACYGRGGPLTVTDCNVFLGRVPRDKFPFPLDHPAIERRLVALCQKLATAEFGKDYTPLELAEGFLEIANAAMARAIRKVSVSKGYDPADYVLVPFGGAGGQHACAVARLLGMKTIIAHPLAGVLSAYGIGQADVRRSRQITVLEPFSSETLSKWQSRIDELIAAAREEVVGEGIVLEKIAPPEITLDLRYRGVEATIPVRVTPGIDPAAAYAAQHRQLYGYDRPDRALELAAIRVEVIGGVQHDALLREGEAPAEPLRDNTPGNARGSAGASPSPEDNTYRVITRVEVQPGQTLVGPAILAEPTSTLVIDPGFTATILPTGAVRIIDHGSPGFVNPGSVPDDTVDPVQLELFHHTFGSFAEQMGLTLQQTSVSTNVKERLDFSCAIFDPQGGLVVNAPHIPVHLGAMSETVKCILRDNPDMAPGNVYVTNDPYRGGSHLPDVTVVTPVHHPETRELLFFTASRAHHAEIGGIVPGSMPPFSKNLGEEGVLIRNFKLISGVFREGEAPDEPSSPSSVLPNSGSAGASPSQGISHEDSLETLLRSGTYPSRSVSDNLADVRAQVAANRIGVTLLMDLVKQRGSATVQNYMRHLQAAAATAMRRALAALPPGDYCFTDHLDDGTPISATITLNGDKATIDFTGTGPVLATNLNANRAIVTAAVMYVLRCLIGRSDRLRVESQELRDKAGSKTIPNPQPSTLNSQLPLNGGVLEPITIVLPECLLNPPEREDSALCPAMVGGNVETSQRVVDVLLGAFDLAAASQGTMNNLTFGDGTFGYYETICGGAGATATQHGADAVHTHMTNTRLTDPEVIERRYPVRLHEFSIRRGSGGQGHHHGGDGIVRRLEFLKPVRVSLLTERRGRYAPYGLHGGESGALGRNTLQKTSGEMVDLGGKASLEVAAGEMLTIETPGGGGYGKPN